MPSANDDKDAMMVGKFIFSKASFQKAINLLKENIGSDGWLIIDEIEPLEIRG